MSRDGGDKVNQVGAVGGRVVTLNFQRYQQSQGGKFECRVGTLWTLEIQTTCTDKSVSLVYYLHTQNPPKSQHMYIA